MIPEGDGGGDGGAGIGSPTVPWLPPSITGLTPDGNIAGGGGGSIYAYDGSGTPVAQGSITQPYAGIGRGGGSPGGWGDGATLANPRVEHATANTGGGGGGSAYISSPPYVEIGGNGGSGIVLIAYPT